ncbi:steryl-sulfatase [Glycocaulis alkaliphilus]|uniref:Steryl-sulfatase n=1 Tax=Glycocaulis alkaliphilus TaxID=1434191 RepID=A0A3T0ECX3_9PROT|nr:sulfatase [Glycocaulis alkaliphilus]AZU05113.1 steryl-sulfatase [Glycocaulis alkaliphilus]GGB65128.1 sulfatase [Glycocaulis alkaliphilus]
MFNSTPGRVILAAGAALVILAAAGFWAFDRYFIYLPGLVQDIRNPIGPNRAVDWQRGPDTAPEGERPPNIILIVADDLGWNDITLHGGVAGGSVPTPNIDRIAREGVQLTNAYAASGTCAPSRAALMTGRYPARTGFEFTPTPPGMTQVIRHVERGQTERRPFLIRETDGDVPDFADMGLPTDEITLAEMLSGAGYHTMHIGKWHLGNTHGSDPLGQGFDESLELAGLLYAPAGAPDVVEARQDFDPIDQVYWAIGRAAVTHNNSARFTPDGYLTDYFTREAVEAIEANRNRPFFLYLAHWAPHSPLQATREDYDALAHIEDHPLRVYAAMIRALDRGIGEVMDALEANGIADNTIIAFTSDNGGAHYIGLEDINAPYRGWKATFFGGGIRVPTFVSWPGRIEPGTEMPGLAQHIDFAPTLAAIAGASLPADRLIDGVDLTPFLTGEAEGEPRETLFWRSGHYEAVIHQGWKLQRTQRPDRVWLFDLSSDPEERNDLSAAEPQRVAALAALLDEHAQGLAEPLWPSIAEMPVSIDQPLGWPESEDDEYVYWPN